MRFSFLLGAALALTVPAALILFSTFMVYDDEGYVLFSYKNFLEHGHLYGDVYSQYGPFPYALAFVLHGLGLDVTHLAGRALTLLGWSSSALLCGSIVLRATRNLSAALVTLTATFTYLWVMVNEPSHPGGLIVLIIAVMAALGGYWLTCEKPTHWALLAGAGSAALLLTKINVGCFAIIAVLAFVALHSRNERILKWSPTVIPLLFAVLPFALMRPLLGLLWVKSYAAIFTLSAIPAMLALREGPKMRVISVPLRCVLLGGAAVATPVIGLILWRGTQLPELLEGVVLGPLRHPVRFNLEFRWPLAAYLLAGVSLLLFIGATWTRRRGSSAAIDNGVAWLRVISGIALLASVIGFPAHNPGFTVFAYSGPCLWLFLWRLPNEGIGTTSVLRWLGLLWLGQYLHAYPIPGSQIGWGTFLAIPLASIGTVEAARHLVSGFSIRAEVRQRFQWFATAGCLAACAVLAQRMVALGRCYFESRDLGLHGAEIIRVPDNNTAAYRILTVNAVAHSDMVFSLPGMFSFNLWSGLPAPTLANVTHWFSLLNATQQTEIIHSLESHPRAAVIAQSELVDFLGRRGFAPRGPLYEYLMRNFKTAFALDGFEFRVREGRHVAPLLTGEVLERQPSATGSADFDTLLRLSLLLPGGRPVARIELTSIDDRSSKPLSLTAENTRMEINFTNLSGDPINAPTATTFPVDASRPCVLGIYLNRGGIRLSPERTLVVLRDAAGRELALVRILP